MTDKHPEKMPLMYVVDQITTFGRSLGRQHLAKNHSEHYWLLAVGAAAISVRVHFSWEAM